MASTEYDVGDVTDFPAAQAQRRKAGSRHLAIVRRDESFFAVRDICPHQGARLSSGTVSGTPKNCLPGEEVVLDRVGEVLICPWHGWEYDLVTGKTLDNPSSGRVRTYPVRVEGGRVLVNVG